MDIIEQAREILSLDIGWIELDLEIDLKTWKKESELVHNFMVEHRAGEGHQGWQGCSLHGIDTHVTGHRCDKNFKWTALSKITPNITNFWKKFPSENYARIRFMNLAPYGRIAEHNDSPGGKSNQEIDMMDLIVPINIAINHPSNCNMHIKGHGTVPWKEGKAFLINITKDHYVKNESPHSRLHLIAHCILGNKKKEFAELIVKSYKKHK